MGPLERYRSIIEDYEEFRDACKRPLPTVVRVNEIKSTMEQATRGLSTEGIPWKSRPWNESILELECESPGNTWAYFHGWIHGQEEISSLPVTVLAPRPGERILDACAAPGGKTAQIAALINDEGLVIANDDNLGRLSALRFNTERLGVTNVMVTREDARHFSTKNFGFERFDRVLVDVPCSCEGTVRKNPHVIEDWTLSHVRSLSELQIAILRKAIDLTKAGGTVVYGTCTFAPEENEQVVDTVVRDGSCRIVPFDSPLPSVSGVRQWRPPENDHEDEFVDSITNTRRYYPHLSDTGGFYCAKLEVTS